MTKVVSRSISIATIVFLAATFSNASDVVKSEVIRSRVANGREVIARKAVPTRTVPGAQVAVSADCSGGASLSGWYGMLVAGSKFLSGAVYFNGACGAAGYNIISATSTGEIVSTSVSGSYNTNADGTVAITLNLAGQTAPLTFLVGVRKSTPEAVGIETDGNSIATIDLQSQNVTSNLSFTTASLSGTFSAVCSGSAVDLNYVAFDGQGNLAGVDPYANSGGMGNSPYSGTYTVNPDGTIQGGFFGSYSAFSFFGVIDNSGSEIEYVYTIAGQGSVVSCIGKQ